MNKSSRVKQLKKILAERRPVLGSRLNGPHHNKEVNLNAVNGPYHNKEVNLNAVNGPHHNKEVKLNLPVGSELYALNKRFKQFIKTQKKLVSKKPKSQKTNISKW
jgi:hypothetical protein